MERLFFCYSERFKRALVKNGFNPICFGLSVVTGEKFWVFWGTNELNDYKNNAYQKERDKY